jgi:uncharacterized membrane protein
MTTMQGGDARARDWENRAFWGRIDMERNVGLAERWISGAAGVALIAFALGRQRWRLTMVPVGLGLVHRAVTGRCELKRALVGLAAKDERRGGPVAGLEGGVGRKIEQSVTIQRPQSELFLFWRRFENLPRFMDNLESVTVLDDRRSHWVAKGPLGTRVAWDAEIHNEIEGELIAWRSLPGADVDQAGSVHFSPAPDGGTDVRVIMRYAAPARRLGEAVAHAFGDDPERQVADDLRRFKQVMDAGVVAGAPTSMGSV